MFEGLRGTLKKALTAASREFTLPPAIVSHIQAFTPDSPGKASAFGAGTDDVSGDVIHTPPGFNPPPEKPAPVAFPVSYEFLQQ